MSSVNTAVANNVIAFPSQYLSDVQERQEQKEMPTAEKAFETITDLPTNELEKLHKMLKEAWLVRPQNYQKKKGA